MTKPIWELEPEEIGQEMALPSARVPRSTELTRLEARLAALPTAEPGGVDEAFAEFEAGGETMFTPSAWHHDAAPVEVAQGTELSGPTQADLAIAGTEAEAAFSPPTAKISRDQLKQLRAQLKGAGKK